LSDQWRFKSGELSGATTTSYLLNGAQFSDSGSYDVVITNVYGWVTSTPALLSVVRPLAVSGHITDAGTAAGLSGVTVLLTNQTFTLSTNTDAAGYYVFTNLWPGSTNTVIASLPCEMFLPAFTNVVLGNADSSSVDFVGLTNDVFTIQGQVTQGLAGLSGVSLQLSNQNALQTVPTDSGGFYGFSRLCPGKYLLTPSAPGHLFTPPSLSVSVGPNANQVNFAAVPVFTISGQILGPGGAALSGVTVFINTTNHVQTDANGYYTNANVPAGFYSLAPSLACYRFTPSTTLLAVGTGGTNTADFFATNDVYQLGGRVTAGTTDLNGLTLKLIGPNVTNSIITTNGVYLFGNLCPGAYTIEPQALGCYQFSPPNHPVNAGPDNTSLDFQAYGAFSLSGRITLLATNPLAGVTVATLGTNEASEAISDANGEFSLLALCAGSYQIAPSLPGYRFTPSSLTVAIGPDNNGLGFAAAPILGITGAAPAPGPVQLAFPAVPGLVYNLNASTNLRDWQTILTTNTAGANATNVVFSDGDSTNNPVRFYRLGDH
jgi:hypothetical protein